MRGCHLAPRFLSLFRLSFSFRHILDFQWLYRSFFLFYSDTFSIFSDCVGLFSFLFPTHSRFSVIVSVFFPFSFRHIPDFQWLCRFLFLFPSDTFPIFSDCVGFFSFSIPTHFRFSAIVSVFFPLPFRHILDFSAIVSDFFSLPFRHILGFQWLCRSFFLFPSDTFPVFCDCVGLFPSFHPTHPTHSRFLVIVSVSFP